MVPSSWEQLVTSTTEKGKLCFDEINEKSQQVTTANTIITPETHGEKFHPSQMYTWGHLFVYGGKFNTFMSRSNDPYQQHCKHLKGFKWIAQKMWRYN